MISKITDGQWKKVLKALTYSVSAGFTGGLFLSLANVLQSGTHDLSSLAVGAIVGGVVGALNGLAVTVKQLFTTDE